MTQLKTVSNKRIAKNTLLLYVRMFITMLIGLFSVRIILRALGESDYGIYNVVGGIITMLAFLNNTLASTTQRFLSYELGNENSRYKEFFKTSLSLYILLCLVLVFIGETIGLWFVNNKLTIPPDRMFAANCVYQFSIVSFIFTVLSAPYNAAIIAHERMSFFAYVSVVDSLCKLAICFALLVVNTDKLIVYSCLMMIMSLAVFVSYIIYCNINQLDCHFKWCLKKEYINKVAAFAGWGTFGAFSNIFRSQGINFLLNIFFGPAVNAARGIAYQAEAALLTLVQNFYIAVRPQAIKTYAEGDKSQSIQLVLFATKIGYVMMLFLFSIMYFEASYVFQLWLGEVNNLTVIYFRIIMISVLFDTVVVPLTMLIHANGDVKRYQIFSGIITISSLLLAYLFLVISEDEVTPMMALPIISIFLLINVVVQVRRLIPFPLKDYMYILLKLCFATIFVCFVITLMHFFINEGLDRFLLTVLTALILTFISLVFVLSIEERNKLKLFFISQMKRIVKN